jgi:hypothetical protein
MRDFTHCAWTALANSGSPVLRRTNRPRLRKMRPYSETPPDRHAKCSYQQETRSQTMLEHRLPAITGAEASSKLNS